MVKYRWRKTKKRPFEGKKEKRPDAAKPSDHKYCMKIIPQRETAVNTIDNFSVWSESAEKVLDKWTEHKKSAKRMAEKMKKAGLYSRANRMEMCGEVLHGVYCPECGKLHITKTVLCRDRLCPICTWRLSMKRFANMVGIMDGLRSAYPGAAWQFVTLTVKNCTPDALPSTIDEMCRAWNSIASRKTFKAKIAGWARSLEITYNEKTKEVHPHFHMLLMWHEEMTPDENYLIDAWLSSTLLTTQKQAQNSQVVKSKTETGEGDALYSAVLETYKYTVKSSDIENMPIAKFKKVAESIKGRRLVAFGGKVKTFAKLSELDDMETPEDEETARCVKCGSKAVRDVCAEWAGTGYKWLRN